jgi:hypothetical protein
VADPASRYDALPTYRRALPGAPDQLLREPRLPTAPAVEGRHRVQVGERLDHVAARHLDDPYAWWRFADAQPGVDVDDLDRPGHWLPLPRRGG